MLLPHDWLTWQLGGRQSEPATDRGDASGTGYFDATAGTYRDDLVRLALGHDLRLPRVAAPDAVVGETAEGVRLAAGTGDNMAAGLGLGITAGAAVVSLGTSGTAFTTSPHQTHDPTGTVAGFADATGAFLPLVCTLNAARNLSSTAHVLNVGLAEFAELALTAPPGSDGVIFVPYLEGERTPPLPTATRRAGGTPAGKPAPGQSRPGSHRGDPVEPGLRTAGAAAARPDGGAGDLDRRRSQVTLRCSRSRPPCSVSR